MAPSLWMNRLHIRQSHLMMPLEHCGNSGASENYSEEILGKRFDIGGVPGGLVSPKTKVLEGLLVELASDLQKVLQSITFQWLVIELYIFESLMGVMLFLLSSLLLRGLESIQADRDDPNLPLVTVPFGLASQEIVNLLLYGEAVPNVFDGMIDLGGGMPFKGIPTSIEVGFLTLLESINLCKVGQFLKCPKRPIWVIESEVEGLKQVLVETNINFLADKLDNLCSYEFIV